MREEKKINGETIMEEFVNRASNELAKELDEVAMRYFTAPKWIAKRKWLYKIYAKIKRFEIREYLGNRKIEFWVGGKKRGEAIRDYPKIRRV